MTSTHRFPADSPSPSPAPGFSAEDRSLFADVIAFTPSATLGRELIALVVNLALAGLFVLIVQPSTLIAVVVVSAMTLYMLGRLVAGFRLHGYGRGAKGGR